MSVVALAVRDVVGSGVLAVLGAVVVGLDPGLAPGRTVLAVLGAVEW